MRETRNTKVLIKAYLQILLQSKYNRITALDRCKEALNSLLEEFDISVPIEDRSDKWLEEALEALNVLFKDGINPSKLQEFMTTYELDTSLIHTPAVESNTHLRSLQEVFECFIDPNRVVETSLTAMQIYKDFLKAQEISPNYFTIKDVASISPDTLTSASSRKFIYDSVKEGVIEKVATVAKESVFKLVGADLEHMSEIFKVKLRQNKDGS